MLKKSVKHIPLAGERRYIRKFCFLPLTVRDQATEIETTVWLKWITLEQEFNFYSNMTEGWENIRIVPEGDK
jgi:hypothetical protein